jgi:transposase InsO family protein
VSLNELYRVLGVSKQAVHKGLNLRQKQKDESCQLSYLIEEIRSDHPSLGIRDLYFKIKPDFMGRDKFENYCKQNGFMLQRHKRGHITTDSSGVKRFDNYINDLKIERLDQVWQSDITYYEVGGRFYYITFILDAYSRRILGHKVSKRLLTDHTTLPALRMAIKARKGKRLDGLIFHSDGGGQYYAKEFLKLTSDHNIINSMCEYAYENGKAERLNGVIKNNYLRYRKIKKFEDLVKYVDQDVRLYNQDKPHIKLKRKTPLQFENNLLNLSRQGNARMKESFIAKDKEILFFEGIEPLKKQGKKTTRNQDVFFAI